MKGTDNGTDNGADSVVAAFNASFDAAMMALQQQQDRERAAWYDLRDQMLAERARLTTEMDDFRTQVDHERARLLTEIDGFRIQADGERARADALRDQLAALEDAANQARVQAQERQASAEARRSAGLLTRLRAAWRGA